MEEYIELFVVGIFDSLEDFFDAVIVPTSKHIRDSFLVSLVFLAISVICKLIGIWCFVDWAEAVVCCSMLGIVSLVDASTRASVRGFSSDLISRSKDKLNNIRQKGLEVEEDVEQ